MPFYNHNRNTRRMRPGQTPPGQANFGYRQTGSRRHEYTAQLVNSANYATGDFVEITNLAFKRTFDGGGTPDVEPTPTAGNNYQSASVMNGSRIENFRKKITIRNNQLSDAATTVQKAIKLDLYELVYSFWDAFIFDSFDADAGLAGVIEFDGNDASPNAGEVEWGSPHPTVATNTIKNSKFLQKYMVHRGELTIKAGEQVEINLNYIPPKCRRSQNGMFWGMMLVNDTIKNHSEAIVISVAEEVSFEEIPSDERQPFLY